MSFTIVAQTFFRSTERLSHQEVARVVAFIRKMQSNPDNPGLGLERIAGTQGMWSARVNRDIRAILHHEGDQLILLHVGHHDSAYAWAKRHRVLQHPATKTIQIVVAESSVPSVSRDEEQAAAQDPCDFSRYDRDLLFSLGVPEEWLDRVRAIQNEKEFFNVCDNMPAEVGENLYALVLGEEIKPPKPPKTAAPQQNPDNLRRLYVFDESEDLATFLMQPFEDWMLFLHPSQRTLVRADFNGPSKVTGAAGTGKTVVAVHRSRHLAASGKHVLLTTYTRRLAANLETRVKKLCAAEEAKKITIQTVYSLAMDLCRRIPPGWTPFENQKEMRSILSSNYKRGCEFDLDFAEDEWSEVIARQAITSWDEYRDASRMGRGRGLAEPQRKVLWGIFEPSFAALRERLKMPWGMICRAVCEAVEAGKLQSPFDAVVVDEIQDLSTWEIRMLASLCTSGNQHLMLIGDAGQRIYPGGFSLRKLGIETRGRSRLLTINYRTTREIARAASTLRAQSVDDLDESTEKPVVPHDLLGGTRPRLAGFSTYEEENAFIASELRKLLDEGMQPCEIGVFARTGSVVYHVWNALKDAGVPVTADINRPSDGNVVFCGTLHAAKGLEFRAVFIAGCSDSFVPLKSEMKKGKAPEEERLVSQRERNLLYVAFTRARELVFVTWTGKRSRFLDAVETHADLIEKQ
jgi:superfamily I DNA/RNA helicase/mRNA-degrading endonuclease RelE of RelBE toxin-antitoxin system